MLKSLGDANTIGGPAASALAQMGLSAKTLASESPDQAFTQIADGLKAIQNPAARAQLAMDLFGKSGQELLPLMMQGSEGIKAAEEQAAKLGLTFNRVDAAKVEMANDAMTRLQGVVEGAAQTLAIDLAPFIDAVATKLMNVSTSGRGVASYITEGFGTVLQVLADLSDLLAVVEAGWQLLRSGKALQSASCSKASQI